MNHRYFLQRITLVLALAAGFPSALFAADSVPVLAPLVKDGSMNAYALTWSDEFDGIELDAQKWNFRTDSKHWSTQIPQNFEVSDGLLKLHVKKEEAGDKHYTGSGVISKSAFRYGYYEARMKVPSGAGWHTSFWMMLYNSQGGTGPNVACQEFDVIENDSNHKNSYGVNVHRWKGEHISFGGKTIRTPDLSADFHVFGCEFTPAVVKYFFDGELVQSVDVSKAAKKSGESVDFEHNDQERLAHHDRLPTWRHQSGGRRTVA